MEMTYEPWPVVEQGGPSAAGKPSAAQTRQLALYTGEGNEVLIGCGASALVAWIEAVWPEGEWVEDETRRPLYWLKGLSYKGPVSMPRERHPYESGYNGQTEAEIRQAAGQRGPSRAAEEAAAVAEVLQALEALGIGFQD